MEKNINYSLKYCKQSIREKYMMILMNVRCGIPPNCSMSLNQVLMHSKI